MSARTTTPDDDDRDLAQDGETTADDVTDTDATDSDITVPEADDTAFNSEADNEQVLEEADDEIADDEIDDAEGDDAEGDDAEGDDAEGDDEWDDEWDDEDDDVLSFLDDDDYEVSNLDDEDAEPADDLTDEADDADAADPKLVRKLRNENAARRQKLRELREQSVAAVEQGVNDFASQLAGTLGIQSDGELTPDQVTDTVAKQMAALADEATKARRDLAIYRAAIPAGADMNKLADSKAFTDKVGELDPNADTYQADVAKAVSAALETNPHFKAPPKIDRVGGDFTGGTSPNISDDSVESLQEKRRQRRGIQVK